MVVLGVPLAYLSLEHLHDLNNLIEQDGNVNEQALRNVSGLFPVACGAALVLLFGAILALLGLWKMYKGKDEYGEEHSRDVDRGVLLCAIVIVLAILNGAAVFGTEAAAGLSGATPGSGAIAVVSSALGIVTSLMIAAILYYLVKSFLSPESTRVAYAAMGLYMLAPITSLLASAFIYPPQGYYADPPTVPFDPLWVVPEAVSAIVTAVAIILFLVLYRQVFRRLRSRETRPIWAGAEKEAQKPEEVRWQPPPSP